MSQVLDLLNEVFEIKTEIEKELVHNLVVCEYEKMIEFDC